MKNRFLKTFIFSILLITTLFLGMASAWEIPGGWDNFNRALRVIPDGTVTAPAWAFKSEPSLGFYRSGSGVISVTGGILSALGGSYSLSDSDVAHGMTDVAATNIYGLLNALDAADAGGLRIQGLSDGNAIPLYLRGIIGTDNPNDLLEAISIVAAKKNGTGVQALGALETVLQILNNTTELVNITGSGQVLIGDNANAKSTLGLTINQAGNDDEILSLKSSDVGHSFTTDTETDTFLYAKKLSATLGGAGIWGLSDGDATGLQLTGAIGVADPTNTISAVVINGVKLNGTTYGALGNSETVFQVQNNATPLMTTLGSGSTSFINSVFAIPIITKGPAIVAAGFVGTVTAVASTTVTFSSAADAILAGYDASNPVLGVTLISNALTRYIVSWTNSTTCVVDTAVTWAGTAITSVQFPITVFVDSAGVVAGWMLANKNTYWVGNQGIGTTNPGSLLHVESENYPSVRIVRTSTETIQPRDALALVHKTSGDMDNEFSIGIVFELQDSAGINEVIAGIRGVRTAGSDDEGAIVFLAGTNGNEEFARINNLGNVGIGTTTFGTSLAGGLAMGVGTAATSQPANIGQAWVADIVAGDARWQFLGEAGNAIYFGNSVISGPGMQLVHTINKAASANVRNSHDAETTHTGDTVYTKAKTITLPNGLIGAARFLFNLKTSDAGTPTIAYGRIYRNGVALGTEQTDITGGYVTKSEDLTQTWNPGDTCELWVKIADGTDTVYVQNFRIAYDDSASITVASSNSTP